MRRINIMAQSPVRVRVDFTFGVQMPLSKLMQAYADYFDIDRTKLVFRSNGEVVLDSDTPNSLELPNGSIFQVTEKYEEQIETVANAEGNTEADIQQE